MCCSTAATRSETMKASRLGLGLLVVLAMAPVQQSVAQYEGKPRTREVWAAQPVVETPYKAPNRLIWRIADILASHKGAQSWTQAVGRTRDFAGDYVSMAPGEKAKSSFYS